MADMEAESEHGLSQEAEEAVARKEGEGGDEKGEEEEADEGEEEWNAAAPGRDMRTEWEVRFLRSLLRFSTSFFSRLFLLFFHLFSCFCICFFSVDDRVFVFVAVRVSHACNSNAPRSLTRFRASALAV